MSFGLGGRSGSFQANLNPFGSQTGGLGQYEISGAANEEASLDKYAATVAWNQGRITDGAYIHALEKYAGTTEKGTREYISAQSDIADAKYTISRNSVINDLNMATGTARRISLWQDLISVDRQHLATMGAQDNEQRRELLARIDSEQGSVRKESWGAIVRRYNGRGVSIDRMLATAKRLAHESTGSQDHQDWLDQVQTWTDNRDTDTLNKLKADWAAHPATGGGAVLDFLDRQLATVARGTPKYDSLLAERQKTAESIRTTKITLADNAIDTAHSLDQVSDKAYLDYYAKRLKDAKPGSTEEQGLKVKVYDLTFQVSESAAKTWLQSTGDNSKLLGVYHSALMGMDKGTAAYINMQQQINDIQSGAWGSISILSKTGPTGTGIFNGGTGYFSGGTPPPTQGTGAGGFASQFDGSPFASDNCGFTSAAMLAWAAGVKGLSGGDMRWYSGDTSGMSLTTSMATAMQHVGLGLEIDSGYGLADFRRRVANGEAAIVNGLYGNLSGAQRLSSFSGAHSVTVTDARKSGGQWWYYVMDPIGRSAGAGARWWPEDAMRAFAWSGATNPLTGNKLDGVVMFARKDGKVIHRGALASRTVPFQAFDTDAHGRSTVGKGGGKDRAEAGYMPPDFASRARGGKPGKGVDSVDVNSFLGAVSKVISSHPDLMPQSPEEEAKWYSRAEKLLKRYDGNVMLAGAQWFNVSHTPTDTSQWTKNQRTYANAIAKQFGLAEIPAGSTTVLDPSKPPAKAPPAAPPAAAPVIPLGGSRNPEAPADTTKPPAKALDTSNLGGYSQESIDIATATLKEAGVATPSPDQVRSVITVMQTLNPGGKVDAANPFNLHTDNPAQYPGQTGIAKDGSPEFSDAADIRAANIAAFVSILSPEVIAGLKSNDPKQFYTALATSGLSTDLSSANLIHANNSNPGTTQIFGLDNGLQTPSSFADEVKTHPALATMFSIDVTDPVQVAKRKENTDSIAASIKAGADHWTFHDVAGSTVSLPFQPYMGVEWATNTLQLGQEASAIKQAGGDGSGSIDTMDQTIADLGDPGKLSVDSLGAVRDYMTKQAVNALYLPQGAAVASRILGDLYNGVIPAALGSYQTVTNPNAAGGPGGEARSSLLVGDPSKATNPIFAGHADLQSSVSKMYEDAATDPVAGSILWLLNNGGFDANQNMVPDSGFVTFTPDKAGTFQVSILTAGNSPDLFVKVKKKDPTTGTSVDVPAYTVPQDGKALWVPVEVPGGGRFMQQAQSAPAALTIYAKQPVSTSRAVSVAGLPGQQNTGPLEANPIAATADGVLRITYPDPNDVDHKRFLTAWTIGNPKADGSTRWVITDGQMPALIYNGTGTVVNDPAKGLTIDGNAVTPDQWADFGFYGDGGNIAKGVGGVGAPGKEYTFRDVGPGMPLDGALTLNDRHGLGGDYFPKGATLPPVDRRAETPSERTVAPVARNADGTTTVLGAAYNTSPDQVITALPPGGTSPEQTAAASPTRPGDWRGFMPGWVLDTLNPPAAAGTTRVLGADYNNSPNQVMTAMPDAGAQGVAPVSLEQAFHDMFTPIRQSVALNAQNAQDAANQSALRARNEALAQERQAQIRTANAVAAVQARRVAVTPLPTGLAGPPAPTPVVQPVRTTPPATVTPPVVVRGQAGSTGRRPS